MITAATDPIRLRFERVFDTFSPAPIGARRTVATNEPPGAKQTDRTNVEMPLMDTTTSAPARNPPICRPMPSKGRAPI